MKLFTLFNAIISLILELVHVGRKEIRSSVSIREELEEELPLKKVSILLSKLEQVEELELPEEDKTNLKTILNQKILELTNK